MTLAPLVENIPEELTITPNWICWANIPRRDGKPIKLPVDTNTGKAARTNDPSTWDTFEESCDYYLQHLDRIAGIGFVFNADAGFVGVDIDNCIRSGKVLPRALAIVRELNSYTEISPSGKGLHVICRGDIPAGRRFDGIEVYKSGRYFTVTGHHLHRCPWTINDRGAELERLYSHLAGSL